MYFDKYIHLCNPNSYKDLDHYHDLKQFPPTPLPNPAPTYHGNHFSEFFHQRLVLFVIEYYINGNIQYVLYGISLLSLSIMFLDFIHIVAYYQ